MTNIELADREISLDDFSNFETNLENKVGRIAATIADQTALGGATLLHLTDVRIAFDESEIDETEIEHFCMINGFRRK